MATSCIKSRTRVVRFPRARFGGAPCRARGIASSAAARRAAKRPLRRVRTKRERAHRTHLVRAQVKEGHKTAPERFFVKKKRKKKTLEKKKRFETINTFFPLCPLASQSSPSSTSEVNALPLRCTEMCFSMTLCSFQTKPPTLSRKNLEKKKRNCEKLGIPLCRLELSGQYFFPLSIFPLSGTTGTRFLPVVD